MKGKCVKACFWPYPTKNVANNNILTPKPGCIFALTFFWVNNNITIQINKMMSFIKLVCGVKGIQSPKQPQVLILPENNAYPVKKVKKTIKDY
mgnify:CR=1 FL=1